MLDPEYEWARSTSRVFKATSSSVGIDLRFDNWTNSDLNSDKIPSLFIRQAGIYNSNLRLCTNALMPLKEQLE